MSHMTVPLNGLRRERKINRGACQGDVELTFHSRQYAALVIARQQHDNPE